MTDPAFETWLAQARAVPLQEICAHRSIRLRGKVDCCGPCPKCGGDDRFSINTAKQVYNCRQCGAGGHGAIDFTSWLDGVEPVSAAEQLNGPPPKANGKHHTPEPREVTRAAFVYKDESGNPLLGVKRFEYQNPDGSFVLKDGKRAKTFKQYHPNPDKPGEWLLSAKGVRLVPYRLPELIEAIGNGHTVLIVEGEAKVDALRKWNVPATCNVGGAQSWKPEYAAFLRGTEVCILPDNDKVGREYADAVGASLQGVAAAVHVLELPGLPPKGDILDWARAGGTVEQLHELLRHAKPWAPAKAEERATQTAFPPDTGELQSICAANVKMRAIEWLWPDRFAVGKLGIIAGLPDEGKGQILAYIIAMITTSGLWPCDEGRAPKGKVVLLTAEDDVEDTVVPRLVAAGADLSRVEIIRMVVPAGGKKERMFSLITDLDMLARKIAAIGNVRLVLIDPISAYMGVKQIDSFRINDVRSVLAPVVEMAAKLRVAFIGIMHFNKKTDVTSALLRISDSLAYGATARHVYAAIDDAENKRKLFVKAKNNLAKYDQQSLAYHFGVKMVGFDEELKKDIWAPYIEWDLRPVVVSANEAMEAASNSKTPRERTSAKKFLEEFLADGPRLQKDVTEAAEAHLISNATLRRAKDDLGVIAEKEKEVPKGKWRWFLPEQNHKEHWSDK
jgi:hypothetical protein